MPGSTITLDTQYYQELCEVIIQQEKMIGLYKEVLKKCEKESELKNEYIKHLKESVDLRDRTIVEYDKLKEMLKL